MVRGSVNGWGGARRLLLSGCATVALVAGMATDVVADGDAQSPTAESRQSHAFEVEPQSLHAALNQWSIMTGKDWGHIGPSLINIRTNGVHGRFTDHAALARILSGTGYTFNIVGPSAVSIVPVQAERVAEVPPENEDSAAEDDRPIETIVVRAVTAQRREQDIQDVPVAVSAFNETLLSQRQIHDTADLSRNVLNLIGSNNVGLGTSVTYFMRGVGSTESIATFDLPVGTYVDEVYISRQNSNQIRLTGVERVEVMRGPQGTLFGRNTTGGAVAIISQKPHDEFGAEAEVGYGSFDRVTATAYTNVPVADNLFGRFSAFVVNEDGFMDNEFNDETFNGEKSWGARGALRILPYETVTWDVSAQYIETDYLQIGTPEILDPAGAGTQIPVTGDLLTARLTDRECEPTGAPPTWPVQGCHFNSTDAFLTISNLQFDFDVGTLSLITGYYDLEQRFNIDFLGNTDQPVFGGFLGPSFYISNMGMHSQFSQEVKWTGKMFNDRLSYVSGFFYMTEDNETRFTDTVFFVPGVPFILADRAPLANETQSIALYTQADFKLVEDLTLQAGVRWTEEDKDLSINGTITNADLDAAGVPRHQNASRWTPRVALSYDFTKDHMVYASFTQGFKSGGWNARGTSAIALQPFGPESVDSWEIGTRTEWFDGRLLANLTLFRAIYDDFQIPSTFPGASTFITLNSGTVEVDGLEMEFAASVTDTLSLFGNLGLMDGEYTRVAPAAVGAGIGLNSEPTRTPAINAQIGFVQDFHLSGGHLLQLASDVKYTGEFEHLSANLPEGKIDDTVLLNAQLSWTVPNENWQFIAECSNCTNHIWFTQNFFHILYPADPRRWSVRVQYRY